MKMSFKVARGCHDFSPTILPLADMWATASTKGQRNKKEIHDRRKGSEWKVEHDQSSHEGNEYNTNAWHLENRT